MNEFERRRIETAQNHVDIHSVVASLGESVIIEHFGYSAELGSAAAPFVDGVTQSIIIPMQSDAYFVLQYISTCVVYASTTNTFGTNVFSASGHINMQITDTGAGEVLYNVPAIASILAGTPNRAQVGIPLLLPMPRVIPPNVNIKIDATQTGHNATSVQAVQGFWVGLFGSRVAQV